MHAVTWSEKIDNTTAITSSWGLPLLLGHYRCKNCIVGPLTSNTKEFKVKNHMYKLKKFSICWTTNVIYAICCPCDLLYIGQRTQMVKHGITQHRSRIRCKVENAPLVAHYLEKNHSDNDIFWQVIVQPTLPLCGGDLQHLLNRCKCRWIVQCNSVH